MTPHADWTTRRRKAEGSFIPAKYQITELTDGKYRRRAKRNEEDSDATLIINIGALEICTLATRAFAQKIALSCFVAQLDVNTIESTVSHIVKWLHKYFIQTLNFMGPRESKRSGIYRLSYELLTQLLTTHNASATSLA